MHACMYRLICLCKVELEMDLILSQKDKLVPGIQKYSESFTGKAGESLKKIRENEEGMMIMPRYT